MSGEMSSGESDRLHLADLGPDDVHVWVVGSLVSATDEPRAKHAPRSPEQVEPPILAERLPARRRAVAGLALRAVLGTVMRADPARLVLVSSPDGKPELPGAGLAFNLSHSGNVAAVAVTRRRSVGVDVEVRDRRFSPGLARRILTTAEHAQLEEAPPENRLALFLDFWTVKEACVKAQGVGITAAMARIEIEGVTSRAPMITGARGGPWAAARFDAGAQVAGAVVASGGAMRVVTHRPADLDELRRQLAPRGS